MAHMAGAMLVLAVIAIMSNGSRTCNNPTAPLSSDSFYEYNPKLAVIICKGSGKLGHHYEMHLHARQFLQAGK